jgi:hypothetical protein
MSDTKCAPNVKYQDGSCFTLDVLKDIAIKFNQKHKNKSNHISVNAPRSELIKNINSKMDSKCDDQICWIKELVNDKLQHDKILSNTFRPIGPDGKYDWLSTSDINMVMEQYMKVYDDFAYLGTVPYDFEIIIGLEFSNNHFIENNYKNGRTKFGMVINLDTHDMNGSHWVALYADLKNNQVYFFDSAGDKPRKRIRKFVNRIVKFIYYKLHSEKLDINHVLDNIKKNNNTSIIKKISAIDIRHNNVQHQFGNTECGVYSINFILRLLEGESFNDIINNITLDESMNKNRKIYFRNA